MDPEEKEEQQLEESQEDAMSRVESAKTNIKQIQKRREKSRTINFRVVVRQEKTQGSRKSTYHEGSPINIFSNMLQVLNTLFEVKLKQDFCNTGRNDMMKTRDKKKERKDLQVAGGRRGTHDESTARNQRKTDPKCASREEQAESM